MALFGHGFDFRCLFPWIPGLLIAIPAVVQRIPYKRRATHKVRLVAGAAVQCVLVAMLAQPGHGFTLRVLSGVLLLVYCTAFLFDYLFFRTMWHVPGEDILVLGLRERHNLWLMVRGHLPMRDRWLAGVAAIVVLLPVLFPAPEAPRSWLFFAGAAGLVVLALMGRRGPPPGEALGSICRAARHAPKIWKATRIVKVKPRKRVRKAFPGSRSGGLPRMNVLTILNESLARREMYGNGANGLNGTGGLAETMPRMAAFLREREKNVFQFSHAISNSTASDVSYPTILTGLSPSEEWTSFDTAPLLWDAAKKAGYETALYTAWNTDWRDLTYMMTDKHLDRFVDPAHLAAPQVNDLGMDDRVLTRHVADYLKTVSAPFFTVVAYNAQHTPCMVDPAIPGHDLSTTAGRYRNSLALLDGCLNTLFNTLHETGQLERTVIFFMSDHGEIPANYDKPKPDDPIRHDRWSVFTHDLLSVPFWMHLPDGAATTQEIAALRANQSRIISNLDYFPTALSAMKMRLKPARKAELKLAGHDLFQPLPRDRLIPCRNSGIFHDWTYWPVALAAGDELLIYHDAMHSFELLNLCESPRVDRWSETSPAQREMWKQRLVEARLYDARQEETPLSAV